MCIKFINKPYSHFSHPFLYIGYSESIEFHLFLDGVVNLEVLVPFP